ncbi:MAG TPA: hypothetical protein VFK38_05580, partial [Candidatus Limnocylindrales bacterium]|nr:hypothetical protein [Candidatus Limnocylindrales bacterium]
MARAKHTSRAEARRRHRAAQAAALGQPDPDEALEPAGALPAEEPRRRTSFFRPPDVRTDLAALPGIVRSQRSFWLAMGLMLVGFGAALVPLPAGQEQGAGGFVRNLLVQLFLLPQALVPVFIAGFFAPRAAWLLGLLVGLANSALALLLLAVQPLAVGIPGTELASTVISYLVLTV